MGSTCNYIHLKASQMLSFLNVTHLLGIGSQPHQETINYLESYQVDNYQLIKLILKVKEKKPRTELAAKDKSIAD